MEVDGDLTDEIMQMSTEDINFRSQMLGKNWKIRFFFRVKFGVFSKRALKIVFEFTLLGICGPVALVLQLFLS